MKSKEIREMSADEQAVKLRELRAELTTLRIKHRSSDGIESPGRLNTLRKDIARLLTIENERAAKAAASGKEAN